MAISIYFGLPGCGKTTLMTSLALDAVASKRYSNVYCNVRIAVPGVTFIDNSCIGKYNLHDGILLIDEATIFADSRDFKAFSKDKVEYFLLHRHFNVDIALFCQQWDAVDRKIRTITDRVYYVYKGKLLGWWITSYYRIPYGIIIPDPNKANGEKLGEIVQGYAKPHILYRLLFTKRLYRPKYYVYFDSWERPYREELPLSYETYTHVQFEEKERKRLAVRERKKRDIMLRLKNVLTAPFVSIKEFFLDVYSKILAHEDGQTLNFLPSSKKNLSLSNQDPDPSVPIAE